MFDTAKEAGSRNRILVIRLGAMGDIIHSLPAVATLKHGFPGCHLTWVVEPQWAPLLEDNPFVDRVALLHRGNPGAILASCRELRAARYDLAVDFQGLLKSAVLASMMRPERIFGFHQSQVREKPAALFYSHKTLSNSIHVVDKNLDLAVFAGAASVVRAFPLPPGRSEGSLPEGEFVLASPLAGWRSKQWPLEYYDELARLLEREFGIPLVVNGPPGSPSVVRNARPHFCGVAGLIHATRLAAAVVGVDSGPLHLAAALGRPGVAIFGPTDPARNGPYADNFTVLRSPRAATSYRRGFAIEPAMREISPEVVFGALKAHLTRRSNSAGCLV